MFKEDNMVIKKKRMDRLMNSSFNFLKERKIIQKSKLSQGHLEIILSFTLFIGALIFLFIFINPFAETNEVSVIGNIQDKIINEISLEIGKLSVIVGEGSCYSLNAVSYGDNYVEKRDVENNRKYDIYFSDVFSGAETPNCIALPVTDYTLGLYSKETIIMESKIISLVGNYTDDYEGLRTNLGITDDFSFGFRSLLNEEIGLEVLRDTPVGTDIEAKEFPVRVMSSNGDIKELILNIRAWR